MTEETQEFFIHFDLEGENNHSILLNHSIITEETIKTVIFELNKIVFEGKLELQIFSLPAEEGGFLKRFFVMSGSVMTFARLFVESTTGSRIIKGLTGKERGDYVEDKTVIVKEMVTGFLEKKSTDLANSGIDYDAFYRAYDAKNKFYQETLKNPEIKGLGFNEEHIFSIPRNEFPYRIVIDLKNKTSPIDPIEKFHKLKIVSPINTKEDKELCRQVKDVQKKSQRFNVYIEDQNFYDFFLNNPFFINTLIVKISYNLERDDNGEIQIKKKSIVNVYQYNDTIFTPLPKECIIEKAPWEMSLDQIIDTENIGKQVGLFDL